MKHNNYRSSVFSLNNIACYVRRCNLSKWLHAFSLFGWVSFGGVLLSGCQNLPKTESVSATPTAAVSKVIVPGEQLPNIEDVLVHRAQICRLAQTEQDALLKNAVQEPTQRFELEQLLVASCNLIKYQRFLIQQFEKIKHDNGWPESFQALFELFEQQLHVITEERQKQQQVINDLNKTIDALTAIEQDIDSRNR